MSTDTDRSTDRKPSAIQPATGYVPSRSAVLAAAVALAALLLIGASAGAFALSVAGFVTGVGLAVGIAAVDRGRVTGTLLGGLLLVGATGMAVAIPASVAVTGRPDSAGVALAGVLTGLGVARFQVDAIGDGAVSRAIAWLLRVALVVGVLTLLVGTIRLDIGYVIETTATVGSVEQLFSPSTAASAAVGFIVFCWAAFAGIWLLVASLPPDSLFGGQRQQRYRRLRSRTISVAGTVLAGGGLLVALVYGVTAETGLTSEAVFGVVVESTGVRTLLARLLLTSLLVGTLMLVLRSVGVVVLFEQPAWLQSSVAVAGLLFVGALLGTGPAVDRLGSTPLFPLETAVTVAGTTTVGLAAGLAGLIALSSVLLVFPLLSGLGFLPTATAGPRLALTGLVVGSVVVATGDGPGSVVFAGIVAAVVVWDIAEYGSGLSAAVGLTPARRDGELSHAVASLGVGSVALLGTTLVHWLLLDIDVDSDGFLLTVVLAALAVVVVTLVLDR